MNLIRTAFLLAFMTALFMGVGYLIGGSNGMIIAFFIAAATNLFSYWNSDKLVLRMYNAKEVNAHSAPEYYQIVSDLAKKAGLPQPKLYLIDNPQPNAFATGRNPQHAAIAATTGLMQRLSRNELTAVLAHEMAHIQHRDILTMTLTATLAGAISMLGNFALFLGNGRNQNGQPNHAGFIGTIIALIIAPFAAMLVQMAVSRTREYAADERGAELCGNPLWLASALNKIAEDSKKIVNQDAEKNPATAPMFIINPLRASTKDSLFSTHPSTNNRISLLHRLAEKMGITSISESKSSINRINNHQNSFGKPSWMQIKSNNKSSENKFSGPKS